MFVGRIVGIYIAREAAKPMEARPEIRAIAGVGLEGDRYATTVKAGSFSQRPATGREVTLIEREAVSAANAEDDVTIDGHETRRNLVTEGVPLNHLVGRTFRVGAVVLRGVRLAEPCAHLASLTQPGVSRALVHRGGLRADIVEGGVIRVGDVVAEIEPVEIDARG